jgi:hypothetical protein
LLDAISQAGRELLLQRPGAAPARMPSACDFASHLRSCPVRYVLADDLLCECIELAYAEGDELSGCADLMRIPAESLWVEWSEPARLRALQRLGATPPSEGIEPAGRAGTLIHASGDGRSALLRTFWMGRDGADDPTLSPVETLLDFGNPPPRSARPLDLLAGAAIGVGTDPFLDPLLGCASIRLAPAWHRYYAECARTPADREAVLRASLAVAAFDVPILCALFLLLAIRAELRVTHSDLATLNAKRLRRHHAPLLDHADLSLPILPDGVRLHATGEDSGRQSPRMHHVRGHLVRRRDGVFWRRPHWRGHIRLGKLPARTVRLHSGGAPIAAHAHEAAGRLMAGGRDGQPR